MGFLMEGKWWEKDVVEGVQEWLKNTELLTLELGWIHLITGLLKSERRNQKRRKETRRKGKEECQGRKR